MPKMTGARFLAETLHGYGVTHFFFMPVIIPEAMPELERMGITRIMTHGEKAAAYMADAYGRLKTVLADVDKTRIWRLACKTPTWLVHPSLPSRAGFHRSNNTDTPTRRLITTDPSAR